ncbi:MAG TPA: PilZ domain-containing protein [Candidatus Tumulicola sp.]|nr:PilZ domain-containing protein [Candidatus Tumulicola sp.]
MSLFGSLLSAFKRPSGSADRARPRLAPRLPMDEPIKLRLIGGALLPAVLEDLSAGGACIRTHAKLRLADQVSVSMLLGPNLRFELLGRVVYAHQGARGFHARYGVRFISISETERNRVGTYVSEQRRGRQYGVTAFSKEAG